ncbi:integrase catalytic domain-containing protein [Trichonephila clavipes]|nr:integrase catalytic domain-containing protein [Trichonephila clavipes]
MCPNIECNKSDSLKQDVNDKNINENTVDSLHSRATNEVILQTLVITDIQENTGPIEVLLGADVAGKLITGRREELKTGLVALETKLGWTLMGKVPRYTDKKDTSMNIVTMLSQEDIPVSSLWDLEILGIRDTIEQNSREEKEKAVMSHFLETVRQKEDGRYEVHMPWKVDRAFLTDNYELEWLAEGVIEKIPGKELPVCTHYLPHRPVIKETSATSSMKIRPVFDASAKINNHPSLNDCLETGNNLIESVPAILARFRLKPIGVISDIRRAFLQISLHEKDRDFVRFLWYDNEESVKERYSEEFLKKLQDSFYVDNCVTSVQNNAELRIFVESATNVMKEGMFDLRGWESFAIPSESTTSLVLGLIWDKNSDTLEIDSESLKFDEKEKITKRKILSLVSRVFDPIGFLAPVMIQPEVLLQATWKTKEAWDDEVNDEIRKKFLKWGKREQLKYFKNIKIPRWLGVMEESNLSIHTFVDASKTAYAACIFLRRESNTGSVTVQLLQARSRITPMKTITIPSLELIVATIGARLFSSVKHALKISNIKTYFWTDSSTVLTWIIRREQWSVFVANRISEIRKLTTSEDWFHISTDQNPADILSRGCGPKQLQKRKWWQGPDWLKNSKEQWPKSAVNINEKEVEIEKRKSVISANNTEVESISSQLARRFSRFSKMIRVMAWILRFQPKAKDLRKCAELKNEELLNAQKIIFRLIQKECYSNEETRKSLKGLLIFEDEKGILRLKSRLINEEESKDFFSPIILPSKHLAVRRFIAQEHLVNKHAGTLTLLTILRERFWIVKGKRTVRSVIKECLTCKRQKIKHLVVPFPPLPKDPTEVAAVFQVSGVDLAGPLLTKSKQKAWIVLFTCAVFRAVHLELITSLSTTDFIQAMRRFIARRGRISVMYSDNGTNFTGLNNALRQLYWTTIESEFRVHEKYIGSLIHPLLHGGEASGNA